MSILHVDDDSLRVARFDEVRRKVIRPTLEKLGETAQVTLSDMTASGGVISKIGDYPLEDVNPFVVRDRFIALFNRLLSK